MPGGVVARTGTSARPPAPHPRRPRSSVLVVAGPALLALALSAWWSAASPLWRDEYATRLFASLGLGDLTAATSHVDAVLAPYYALMHALSGLTGTGAGMRIPSILATAASAGIVAALALRWWGHGAALTAGIAVALNGAVLAQGANARPYALALCGIALALWSLDPALRGARRPGVARAGYVLASVSAVLMQPLAATALVANAILARGRRERGAWILLSAPWAVAALLLLWRARGQTGQLGGPRPADAGAVADAVARAAGLTGGGLPLAAALIALLAAAAIPASRPRRPAVLALGLVLAPVAILAAVSALGPAVLSWRYLLWTAIGVALLVGAGAGAAVRGPLPLRALARATAFAVLIASAAHTAGALVPGPPPRDDFPGAAAAIREQASVGDLLIVVQRYEQGGVALGFALSAGDDGFAREVVAQAVHGVRPVLAVRTIVGLHPLRTTPAPAAALASGSGGPDDADARRSLWVVSILAADREDPSALPDPLAGCYRAASPATLLPLRPTNVYRIPCPPAR